MPEVPPPYIESPGPSAPSLPTEGTAAAPPPYTPNTNSGSSQGSQFVQCRVCNNVIQVALGTRSRVVKCQGCNEATPISSPPPGKKYVRCPCNCLLTCSATATRVICPRENCKRVIGVGAMNIRPSLNNDRIRVVCGCCARSILWPRNAAVARCPHCRRTTYIDRSWMKRRAFVCLAIGIILFLIGIAVTGGTAIFVAQHAGIVVVYIGAFISGIGFFIRSAFYFAMKQSHPET